MLLTTLCYLERDGKYLMLHRTKKQKDINKDWNEYVSSCKNLNVDKIVDLTNKIYKNQAK